jgi:hypothetical protein
MSDENEAPSAKGLVWTRLPSHWGKRPVIAFVIVIVAATIWWNWPTVSSLPMVAPLVTCFDRWSIPQADPNRFSIIVARLENDPKNDYQRLISEDLSEFKGIQVLQLNGPISRQGLVPDKEHENGHETACGYLKRSGASALIWGKVLPKGEETVPRLYWTPSSATERGAKGSETRPSGSLKLPVVSWSDLSKVLALVVASAHTGFEAQMGHCVPDRLPPLIARVRTLLLASERRPEWDADSRAFTLLILANALQVFGDQTGEKWSFEEAVSAYRKALVEYTREHVPLDWAMTRNGLGIALTSLGEREAGRARLEEAVSVYRDSVKEFDREREPLDWATAQNNLGHALRETG